MSSETLIEIFERNAIKLKTKTLIYSRRISPNGSVIEEKHSWSNIRDNSKRLASVLAKFGENRGKQIAILAENSYRWVIADLAIMYLGAISLNLAPSDASLNIASALKDCDVNTIFISNTKLLSKLINIINEDCLAICNIIILDSSVNEVENNLDSITIYFLDQLLVKATNAGNFNPSSHTIDTNSHATTLMNSGSKNSCKLISLSHRNILSNIESLAKDLAYQDDDNILSCNSLSDIFNKNLAYYSVIYAGASMLFPIDPDNFLYELAYKKVTIACINPKDLAEFEESIDSQLEKKSFTKFLLNLPLVSYFAQSQIKRENAAYLKYFICAGSYLPTYLNNNIRNYGFKIRQSYGTTESAGPISISSPNINASNNLGKIIKCLEWKTSKSGELEISGIAITNNYVNAPEYEAKSFYTTGLAKWFKTGDIIYRTTKGDIAYLGKVCERVLNNQGKTILLSKMEKMLRDLDYIDDVLIIGEDKPFVSALITIRDERFRKLFKKLDKYSIKQQCEKDIYKINLSLEEAEKIRKFAILDHALRINKSELSPNKKIKRKVIEERYQDLIYGFYDKLK